MALLKDCPEWCADNTLTEPPVRRIERPPGVEAQVDFGWGAPVVDAQGK